MSKDVIAYLNEALESGIPAALAILTESGRDTPGVPGGMMAVRADGGRAGTLGGGAAEARVIADCEKALQDPATTTFSFDYSLRKEGGLGMICGGDMRGFVTIVRPAKQLVIFGGGHVGQKLYEAGVVAGFQVVVVEDRPEYAALFPAAQVVIAENFGSAARELSIGGDTYVVVVTRGHAHDYASLAGVIGRGAPYIGMIGSRQKVAGLLEKLRAEGVEEDAIRALYTPVGLDIDDGTPGEIAIAVLAEILSVKNAAELRHRREKMHPAAG